jgi:hypothetical protein
MSHVGIERLHERDAVYGRDRRLTITQSDDGRSDQLIYRVVGESSEWVWSEESGAMRFWFTERGWRAYGLRVAAEARASGRTFRVMRRKNPSKSTVVYRDDWQVALLPDRD